jgi:aspartate/methionine/tyrosine aminotransferase
MEEVDLGLPVGCECHQCYEGLQCETLQNDCVIGGPAEATLSLEWWQRHDAELRLNISGTYHMGYLQNPRVFPAGGIAKPVDRISELMDNSIRQLHKRVGNAETNGTNVVMGAGGVQLLDALMFALTQGRNENRSMAVFARPPYYPHFRQAAGLNPLTVSNASTVQNAEDVIEIVTMPNNPDSRYMPPVYPSSPNIVFDYVYDWPSTADPANTTMRNDPIMVYSLSKLAGFSSSRIGWALIKDDKLASIVSKYIFLQSTAPSVESQLRAVKALRAIERSVGTSDDYFSFFRQKTLSRFQRLQSLFATQALPAGYHLDCEPGNIFVWVRCDHATPVRTCAVGIGGDPGTDFGDTYRHARVVIGECCRRSLDCGGCCRRCTNSSLVVVLVLSWCRCVFRV